MYVSKATSNLLFLKIWGGGGSILSTDEGIDRNMFSEFD